MDDTDDMDDLDDIDDVDDMEGTVLCGFAALFAEKLCFSECDTLCFEALPLLDFGQRHSRQTF